MTYTPLTPDQFKKAREAGYSADQIVQMEKKRKVQQTTPVETAPEEKPGIGTTVKNVLGGALYGFSAPGRVIQNTVARTTGLLPTATKEGFQKSSGIDLETGAGKVGEFAGNTAYSLALPAGSIYKGIRTAINPIIKGKIGQGIAVGATTGAISGATTGADVALQDENASAGDVLKSTAYSGAIGAILGGVTGGVLPAPVATTKLIKETLDPASTMSKVARINPNDARKFDALAGEPHGQYLVSRGIYGTPEEIAIKLAKRFQDSKNVADTELAKLGGTWTNPLITTTLKELADREARVSLPGSISADANKVAQLVAKNKAGGLTMSEINEAKRLYERNVKTGYLKENVSDKIAQATNLDNNLRAWQFEQAKKLGLENLDEINKETQLARQLGDAIYKKTLGQSGNNSLGLTDAILLAGGDPNAIAMLGTKKILGNNSIRSSIAQKLAGPAKVGLPTAKTRQPIGDIGRLLSAGDGNTTNAIPLGRAGDKALTPAQIAANNFIQNSRIQNTRLALPPANSISRLNNGIAIPLWPKATVELPAKAIREY